MVAQEYFECYSCIRSKLVSAKSALVLQVLCDQDDCKQVVRVLPIPLGTKYIRDHAIDIKPDKKMLFYQAHVDAFVTNNSPDVVMVLEEPDKITDKWIKKNTPEYFRVTPVGVQNLVDNGECYVTDLKNSAKTCTSCVNKRCIQTAVMMA